MATFLRTSIFTSPHPPPPPLSSTSSNSHKLHNHLPFFLPFTFSSSYPSISCFSSPRLSSNFSSAPKFPLFASPGEAVETENPELQSNLGNEDNTDGAVDGETSEESSADDGEPDVDDVDDTPTSPVLTALQLYKEALESNDEDKLAEVEAFLKSVEEEKDSLEMKVISLSGEFSAERERVLRISADFENFRKRTERERLSLVTNAQGELIENFLPVVDNFERAKTQIKVETEAEGKINNSYQSIYKQFFEILSSIGVVPAETVGKPFDPMLHEAIMREESTEYDEDVIIEEYRKGFQLGDRLLRPSMVKVSAGPGPEKPQAADTAAEEERVTETSEVIDDETDSGDQTAL